MHENVPAAAVVIESARVLASASEKNPEAKPAQTPAKGKGAASSKSSKSR
jgi:hypothetical protein